MFARIASRYDFVNTIMTGGAHHSWRRRAIQLVSPWNGWALDVATGTGDLALELARHPHADQVVGLDVVPEMLKLARKKSTQSSFSQQITWLHGDAMALPFPNAVFGTVTSGFGLRNVSNLPLALREMVRVTAPGGRIVIVEITPVQGDSPVRKLIRFHFRHVTPWIGAIIAGNREAYTYLPNSVENFPNPETLADLLRHAGARNVQYQLVGLSTVAIHWGTC